MEKSISKKFEPSFKTSFDLEYKRIIDEIEF